jgi:hypothetical protein
MSGVAFALLVVGALALAALLLVRLRAWRDDSRRSEASRLRRAAARKALVAEDERQRAVRIQAVGSAEVLDLASERRERAERQLEDASGMARRARRLSPDVETDPD